MREGARTATTTASPHSAVVELRQYTLRAGQRDVLISIFERHFIEAQEDLGAKVIGHFRDLDNPDRFVWVRGFRDMPSRAAALEAFYTGDVWKEHRDAANDTLVDHENVLLLRPARAGSGFAPRVRAEGDPGAERKGLLAATIYPLVSAVSDELVAFFDDRLKPELVAAGAEVVGAYVTEASENNYPRLAIREGENVFVWFARFPDRAAHQAHVGALGRSRRWRELANELPGRLSAPPQRLRLVPAAKSELA